MKSEGDPKITGLDGHDTSDHQKVFTWEQEDDAITELISMQKENIRHYKEKKTNL